MLDLTGHMIIWGGLFAHGDGSTGLMSRFLLRPTCQPTHDCRNGGLRVERAHCHGIFSLSDYHQERTSPTYNIHTIDPFKSS
jgi:hypothetical protein